MSTRQSTSRYLLSTCFLSAWEDPKDMLWVLPYNLAGKTPKQGWQICGIYTTLGYVCPWGRFLKSIMMHILIELGCCMRILLTPALHAAPMNHSALSQERKPGSYFCPGPTRLEQQQSNIVNYSMINDIVLWGIWKTWRFFRAIGRGNLDQQSGTWPLCWRKGVTETGIREGGPPHDKHIDEGTGVTEQTQHPQKTGSRWGLAYSCTTIWQRTKGSSRGGCRKERWLTA